MKVIVVEDDLILCDSYKYYFESFNEYTLVGIYNSVQDALDDYDNTYPDIIVSDISIPGGINGIDGIKLFKERDKNVKVIIVSVHDDLDFIKGAFENSADGYLSKPILKHNLYGALNTVKFEGAALGSSIAKNVISIFQKKSLDMLSERENEIMDLLGRGETYKSIASKLFLSASTVNFHIQNAYLKLNVNSKAEALKKVKELKASL